jgi:hypothetical protein
MDRLAFLWRQKSKTVKQVRTIDLHFDDDRQSRAAFRRAMVVAAALPSRPQDHLP